MTVTIYPGDALQVLKTLEAESVQCCVTSPPYWGLRDYGVFGQIGLEPTPDLYVAALVNIFREVRRVLRDDGCLWLNLGDSYASKPQTDNFADPKATRRVPGGRCRTDAIKPKDLVGIPWMVAFALRADGWYLRSDVIWAKPNPMPESVTDRPTKAHEYLFLLTKSARYYYDAEAVREPAQDRDWLTETSRKGRAELMGRFADDRTKATMDDTGQYAYHHGAGFKPGNGGRNLRTVWTIATQPYSGAHFATFPPALAERCIKAGTSEKGRCPACGKPWERVVEKETVREIQERIRPIKEAPSYVAIHGPRSADKSAFGSKSGVSVPGNAQKSPNVTTTGWQPGCTCGGADPVPCAVLDPFGGAGTTGLVADRLGRDATLIELNPEYCQMQVDRIKADGGFMSDVRVMPL